MNLFSINTKLAVKLNQSFESLYNLPYYEYSSYYNLVKESQSKKENDEPNYNNIRVNLPNNLK
jgi:hypothetical protein